MIILIENVTRVNNNTEILKFIMLNITGESNAPPAVREFEKIWLIGGPPFFDLQL